MANCKLKFIAVSRTKASKENFVCNIEKIIHLPMEGKVNLKEVYLALKNKLAGHSSYLAAAKVFYEEQIASGLNDSSHVCGDRDNDKYFIHFDLRTSSNK